MILNLEKKYHQGLLEALECRASVPEGKCPQKKPVVARCSGTFKTQSFRCDAVMWFVEEISYHMLFFYCCIFAKSNASGRNFKVTYFEELQLLQLQLCYRAELQPRQAL